MISDVKCIYAGEKYERNPFKHYYSNKKIMNEETVMFDFCLLNHRFGNQLVSTTGILEKSCPYGGRIIAYFFF